MEGPEVGAPREGGMLYSNVGARNRNKDRERETGGREREGKPHVPVTGLSAEDKPQPAYRVRSVRVMKYSNTISTIYIRGVPLHAMSTRRMQCMAKDIASHLD